MKLPDFTEFEPFVALRQAMGARKQGHFELFNPERHLNGRERSELDNQGKRLPLHRLRRLADMTWGYKNTRLLVYLPEAADYHLAQCSVTDQWAREQQVQVTTRYQGLLPGDETTGKQRSVCPECLQLLGYKGFDLHRNRKVGYSKLLLRRFSCAEFFQLYRLYPLQGVNDRSDHSTDG